MAVVVQQRSDLTEAMVARLQQWLREERAARGWSITEAADRTKLSRSYLNELERGRRDGTVPAATLDAVAKLAQGFGVPIDMLLDIIGGSSVTKHLHRHMVLLSSIPPEEQEIALRFLEFLARQRDGGPGRPRGQEGLTAQNGAREGAASPEASGSRNGRSDWLIGQILNLQRSA